MSERGLFLALQRLHEDPGFVDLVTRDPQSTLGLYDLTTDEYNQIVNAVINRDAATIQSLAQQTGINWEAPRVEGIGTLSDPAMEQGSTRRGTHGPNAFTGDGYQGTTSTPQA